MNKMNRRRRVAIAATAGVCAFAAVGYGFAASVDSSPAPDAPTSPSQAALLDLSAAVAQDRIGQQDFILAPGKGSLSKPGVLCLLVEGPDGSGSLACSYADEFAKKGSMTTYTSLGGTTEVWGSRQRARRT